MPDTKILGEEDSDRKGWTRTRCLIDGRERSIEWPPGIRMTEDHLGANWQQFGAGVYKGLWEEIREGKITGSEHESFHGMELWILQQIGGVWWAVKGPGDFGARIVGAGFLYVERPHLIVQSAMIWSRKDRKGGMYADILARLREWIRPGTVFSDACMSAEAVGSWQRAVDKGIARWDDDKGRFRRNPRGRSTRRR